MKWHIEKVIPEPSARGWKRWQETIMNDDKWVKRWVVPSSSGDGDYIVARDKDGNWACSCIGWTRHVPRRDCRHITEVREGGGRTVSEAVMDRLAGR